MNIQLNYPLTSQTFNYPTFSTPDDYYEFEPNTILETLRPRNRLILDYTNLSKQIGKLKKVNTTDFFHSVIFYGCGRELANTTKSLTYCCQPSLAISSVFDNFNDTTIIIGKVYHYAEVLLTKIIHNGEVVFVLHNKTAKGNRFFSHSTSTYVGKIKAMLEYYKIKYVMKNYPKTTKKKIIITAPEVEDTEENCGITLDTSEHLVKTDCGHLFDYNALKDWFYTKLDKNETPDCPLCRTKLEINYSLVGECNHKYIKRNGNFEGLHSQHLDAILDEN
jgi:hypothetical protein